MRATTSEPLRELSLFSGAGGGLLGSILLGWETVGYVEFNDYCQRVLAQRIRDGVLPNAPIFSDVRAFLSEGYAAAYTGLVDVISGGFPCQPFSVAGKRKGADDERNMWPATIECIRTVRPRFAFLENVPGLVSSGYFGTVLGDLAESGYDTRWRILSAAEVGAPHKRDRLWIVAHAESTRDNRLEQGQATGQRVRQPGNSGGKGDMAHTKGRGLSGRQRPGQAEGEGSSGGSKRCGWWHAEPGMGRVVNGMAHRVDRIKSLGNGQVSLVAATAWQMLTEDLL